MIKFLIVLKLYDTFSFYNVEHYVAMGSLYKINNLINNGTGKR